MQLKKVRFINTVVARSPGVERTCFKGKTYELPEFAADHHLRLGNASTINLGKTISKIKEVEI